MKAIFTDCLSLSFLPDISKWKNYNEDDINEIPDYNIIEKLHSINREYTYFLSSHEEAEIVIDDYKFVAELSNKRFERLFN